MKSPRGCREMLRLCKADGSAQTPPPLDRFPRAGDFFLGVELQKQRLGPLLPPSRIPPTLGPPGALESVNLPFRAGRSNLQL